MKKDKGEVKLKRSHNYYYHIQGHLFYADGRRPDFVVWFGEEEPLFVETIFYYEHFISKFILPQLKFFVVKLLYQSCLQGEWSVVSCYICKAVGKILKWDRQSRTGKIIHIGHHHFDSKPFGKDRYFHT